MLNDILFVPINKIKKLVGKTTDTGGSSNAGTVMGKLNNIISNNSTTVIGNTTDTGGTVTTGTVMGKLNNIISGTAKVSSRTKKLTNVISGVNMTVGSYTQANPYRIIGSGMVSIVFADSSNVYFSIDGRSWQTLGHLAINNRASAVELFFEEKIEIYNVYNNISVMAQT